MEKEEFVNKLKSLAPAKEILINYNLPDDFINRFIKTYYCNAKSIVNIKFFSNDVIIMLLQHYDCSKVEIGAASFLFEPVERINFYQIGNVDADILMVNKISLKIQVVDYTSTDHIIWECASNSENFLSAMLLCADLFTSRVLDSSLQGDDQYTLERVSMCAKKAGGEDYIDFYKMLLGYFD